MESICLLSIFLSVRTSTRTFLVMWSKDVDAKLLGASALAFLPREIYLILKLLNECVNFRVASRYLCILCYLASQVPFTWLLCWFWFPPIGQQPPIFLSLGEPSRSHFFLCDNLFWPFWGSNLLCSCNNLVESMWVWDTSNDNGWTTMHAEFNSTTDGWR